MFLFKWIKKNDFSSFHLHVKDKFFFVSFVHKLNRLTLKMIRINLLVKTVQAINTPSIFRRLGWCSHHKCFENLRRFFIQHTFYFFVFPPQSIIKLPVGRANQQVYALLLRFVHGTWKKIKPPILFLLGMLSTPTD